MSKTRLTRFDRYEILSGPERGGMADVYRARDTRLGRIVALKLLSDRLVVDDTSRQRFEREARAGALLEHDHIVTTYDFGIRDGHPFLAVAYVDGESLKDRILRQERLSPEDTIRLVAPIARALAYVHRQGMLHRDIKPSNILIRTADDRPILIDFGLGLAVAEESRLTRRGEMWGTIEYLSPEQARAAEIDGRSDLYSLGVVLYECLTGRVPFLSPHSDVLLYNIKQEPPPPVRDFAPDVPPALAEVVERCLAKDPDARYPDGDALTIALGQSLARPPSLPQPNVPPEPLRAELPPRRRRMWPAGLAVVMLAGALGLWSWFGPSDRGPDPAPGTAWTNSVEMPFVWIPGGSFRMGSEDGEADERPVHVVELSEGFFLGRHEVTQAQWEAVMGENPSSFVGCPECPVESVSWADAQAFIARLNEREADSSGYRYRLPTEAEWEYACRAGAETAYGAGIDPDSLEPYAWFETNARSRTHPAGRKAPNAWGVYDLHGNIWEWVSDRYDEAAYDTSRVVDPAGPEQGEARVIRGGAWNEPVGVLRCSNRYRTGPAGRYSGVGLRLVRTR